MRLGGDPRDRLRRMGEADGEHLAPGAQAEFTAEPSRPMSSRKTTRSLGDRSSRLET